MSDTPTQPEAVTGVQLAQGIGHRPARGFWAEAWSQVIRRPAAVFGLSWIGLVGLVAILAPVLASGHPLFLSSAGSDPSSPLVGALRASDVAMLVWMLCAGGVMLLARGLSIADRLRLCIGIGAQAGITVVLAAVFSSAFSEREVAPWVASARQQAWFVPVCALVVSLIAMTPFLAIAWFIHASATRLVGVLLVASVFGGIIGWKWTPQLSNYDYRQRQQQAGTDAVYTLIPFSPNQSETIMFNRPPGSTPMHAWWDLLERELLADAGRRAVYSDAELAGISVTPGVIETLRRGGRGVGELLPVSPDAVIDAAEDAIASGSVATLLDLRAFLLSTPAPTHRMGTDTLGQDVLSQMLHACRLSISIGFVSTGIAVLIGVTIGAIMGYFGGWIDLLLYRVVEIFMAIPVLFVLIVAAGVLPRNVYVMMAIIGCFSWTGAARFIRAEFMKLRNSDYVQAARAAGLPLRSILFKHMLPNGVTPVLVDTSFTIAAAIIIEAILSFLGLGPAEQASWGKLLSNATGDAGGYMWWLAIFPGAAIFLTALSYNLIGESLRDAIDPKLKKARV